MKPYFTSAFFAKNRRALCRRVDAELIVVTANGLLQRSGDTTFPFRQDSNFWYLTGLDEPDLVLVIDNDHETLLVPEHDEAWVRFEGGIDRPALQEKSGIKHILGLTEGWQFLGASLKQSKEVATIEPPPAFIDRHNFYTNPARAQLVKKIYSQNADITLQDIKPILIAMRLVKQPAELKALQAGIAITEQALQQVQQNLQDFKFEYEIEAFISHFFRTHRAQHGFDPMVAFGQNATRAHAMQNNSPLRGPGLLLLDISAEVDHYAADISRTYAVYPPTKRQLAVFEAVKDVHAYALSLVKPGATLRNNEKLVEHYLGQKLQRLGLIEKPEREAIRYYFPHATSHYLGLDVHDVGDYDTPLVPGMVVTVEPGIYIPKEKIGVRLEDDILITKTGSQNLSAGLPHALS